MWRRLLPLSCPSCSARCASWCAVCSPNFAPATDQSIPPELDALWCRFAYDGAVKNLVLAAKATSAHGWLGAMAGALRGPGEVVGPSSCVVTWPTGSDAHRRMRGYDPAERLARSYGRVHGLRVVELLDRHGGPQEGLSAQGRASLRFVANRRRAGETVFVIDDVVTTGVTMSRAASALRDAGARTVVGVCFARRERVGSAGRESARSEARTGQ